MDSNNNVIITGRNAESGLMDQIYTAKLAANDGDIMWSDLYGGTGADVAWDMVIGSDDHPVITGVTVGSGNTPYFITRKLNNTNGDEIWSVLSPGAQDNVAVRAGWITQMDNGDVVMANRTFSSATGYDIYLERYRGTDGEIMWTNVYDNPTHSGDDLKDMIRDAAGNLLVVGVQDIAWNYDYMIMKFDAVDGGPIWSAGYDGPPGWYDVASCVIEAPDGTIIASGLSDGVGSQWDWATVGFDPQDGRQLWVERFNGTGNQADEARGLAASPSGGLYVTGYSYGIGTNKDMITQRFELPSGATPVLDLPKAAVLSRAWPNPFNPRVNFTLDMAASGPAKLTIYDLRGQQVRVLIDETLSVGSHTASWNGQRADGRPAAAGVYMAIMESEGIQSSRKIVLAK